VFGTLVVAGVGGSPASWQALSWAEAEASASGGRLLICHACPRDSTLATPGAASRMSLVELAEPALARAVAAARARLGGDRVSLVVRAAPPAELLVDVASSADMVVVGAPQRSGLREWGSTTHHVVSHAASPVVVVRPTPVMSVARPLVRTAVAGRVESAPRTQTPPAHDHSTLDHQAPDHQVPEHPSFAGHVVVGVDASSAARAALDFGFRYASTHRRPLVAVTVTSHADSDLWYDDTFGETHLTAEPAALALLEEEVEPWRHKYPDVAVKRAIFSGRVLPGLLRAARSASVLAIGNRGFGPARSVIMGSVSHAVVDRAPCPVAVVRGDDGRIEAL
jgi:nucleotide-binding universal stress UspA family protein